MEISKKSLVVKIAYGWRPTFITKTKEGIWETNIPKLPNHTNLCPFFWRFILSLFVIWPIVIIFSWIILRGVCSLVTIPLFASRPTLAWYDPNNGETPHPFKPINTWPRFRGKRILPGVLLGLLVASGIITMGVVVAGKIICEEASTFWIPGIIQIVSNPGVQMLTTVILLFFTTIFLYFWLSNKIQETSWFILFKIYIKAKKEKMCPIIKFTD